VDSPALNSTVNVLTECNYPNGTGYRFSYNNAGDANVHWAIVNKIERLGSGTHPVQMTITYNYPAGTTAQSGHPTFTTQTVNDGVNSGGWTHSRTKNNGMVSSYTVTDPNNLKMVTNLSTATNGDG
jgi:AICAR transformylase/IMP cyclohydrolase PurH